MKWQGQPPAPQSPKGSSLSFVWGRKGPKRIRFHHHARLKPLRDDPGWNWVQNRGLSQLRLSNCCIPGSKVVCPWAIRKPLGRRLRKIPCSNRARETKAYPDHQDQWSSHPLRWSAKSEPFPVENRNTQGSLRKFPKLRRAMYKNGHLPRRSKEPREKQTPEPKYPSARVEVRDRRVVFGLGWDRWPKVPESVHFTFFNPKRPAHWGLAPFPMVTIMIQ